MELLEVFSDVFDLFCLWLVCGFFVVCGVVILCVCVCLFCGFCLFVVCFFVCFLKQGEQLYGLVSLTLVSYQKLQEGDLC